MTAYAEAQFSIVTPFAAASKLNSVGESLQVTQLSEPYFVGPNSFLVSDDLLMLVNGGKTYLNPFDRTASEHGVHFMTILNK